MACPPLSSFPSRRGWKILLCFNSVIIHTSSVVTTLDWHKHWLLLCRLETSYHLSKLNKNITTSICQNHLHSLVTEGYNPGDTDWLLIVLNQSVCESEPCCSGVRWSCWWLGAVITDLPILNQFWTVHSRSDYTSEKFLTPQPLPCFTIRLIR